MNIYSLLIIYLLFFQPQQNSCANFYQGKFAYENKKELKIYRTLNEQIEFIGDSIATTFSIKWVNNCNYILIPKKVIYEMKIYDLPKDTIFVYITEILSDSSYRYKAVVNNSETIDTIYKVP